MTAVNTVLGGLVGALLFPFKSLPPIVGLLVVSALTAVGMLVVFRATSNQARIAAVKRSIHAGLFEIRLFNDDLRLILRAQVDILRHNLTYLRLSLVPMVWMIVPLSLLIAQMQFHYGYDGLDLGRPVLVKIQLAEDGADPQRLELTAPDGLRVETPPVWIPTLREAAWRIVPDRAGDYELSIQVDDRTYTKSVRTSDAIVRRSHGETRARLPQPIALSGGSATPRECRGHVDRADLSRARDLVAGLAGALARRVLSPVTRPRLCAARSVRRRAVASHPPEAPNRGSRCEFPGSHARMWRFLR